MRISKVVTSGLPVCLEAVARREGQASWGVKKELIMVGVEKNDPLMLARQLPIKSVALILAGGRDNPFG